MDCSRIAGFTLAALVALLLASPDADARGRQGGARMSSPKSGHAERSVTRTGPGGKTATTHDEVHRTDGGYTRETTTTGPNGGVTTRSATGSYDKESKTFNKEVTKTNPDGSTATTQVTGRRTEDGYTKTTTHSGPQGTTTAQGQGTWDPVSKTWTRETVVTRPDGTSAKTAVTTKVSPDAQPLAPVE